MASALDYSTTAASNTSIGGVSVAEGCDAANLNNATRAMAADIAKLIKDTHGALTSGGSSNAYTLTTNQTITAYTVPRLFAFKANHASTGAATLSIDSVGAKSLKRPDGAAIQSGDIASGSVYIVCHESSADVFFVLNARTSDVAGPASSTDNTLPRFDGTGGKTLQGSGVVVDDSNNVSGVVNLDATGVVTVPNTGLHILDTNASHDLILKPGSDITADRTLTITTGDADRTLTLSASATVSQDYSTTGNPQFATIELGAASDTTLSRTGAGAIAVEGVGVALNSTSLTHTASTIELGAATDTTLSRAAAGVLAVEGVSLYPGIPITDKSTAYTTVLGDAQTAIRHPAADNNARTFTIAANASVAYPVGTCLSFINEVNTVTIAITSDTMVLAGAGSTGSRSLAANGVATAVKVASTRWYISGSGLT